MVSEYVIMSKRGCNPPRFAADRKHREMTRALDCYPQSNLVSMGATGGFSKIPGSSNNTPGGGLASLSS